MVPLTGLNVNLIENAIDFLLINKIKVSKVMDYAKGKNISSKLVTILISYIDQINKKVGLKTIDY